MTDASHRDPFRRLVYFVTEREAVRVRREDGEPQSRWTEDEILQTYRFCNVRREDDRVTRWIAENWRAPHVADPDLWFAMCVARFVNLPDCMQEIRWPVPWRPLRFVKVLSSRKARGECITGAAYMISTNGRALVKELFLADTLTQLWAARKTLRPMATDTLCSYHMTLGACYGLGSFLAAQVVADLKYTPPLRGARDWQTFAASGPGSRRGLNRLMKRPVDARRREDEWRLRLDDVRIALNNALRWDEPLHAQDVQNCLCEFDKWERARTGEGRPKQKYRPRSET